MSRRAFLSIGASLLIAVLTIGIWHSLRVHEEGQIRRIVETESYSTRSQLVRHIDTMLLAVQKARDYWAQYGHLPRDQWASDAGIEQSHFPGIKLIVWSDPSRGTRYLRTSEHPVFDYRPTDEEWQTVQEQLQRAEQVSGEALLGPFVDADGTVTVEVIAGPAMPESSGTVIVVVDAQEAFQHFLQDESIGYAVSIFLGDVLTYSRGEHDPSLPEEWVREGLIQPIMGGKWRVVHSPGSAVMRTLRTPAVFAVLVSGLSAAVLLGLLVFESRRATSRANAATAAERELAELNRDLERQVAERTRELKRRATDLETITDSVAHDLRNPLNSISVTAELLQHQYSHALGRAGAESLLRLRAAVSRMADILNRLLGLSFVSHAAFRPKETDMNHLVRDVFEELAASENPSAPTLEVGDLPEVTADPVWVRILMTNLLSNAIKFTREKTDRHVEVSATVEDGAVVYAVRDNGVGFDPAAHERVFEAFERLETDGDIDGLGLGLAVAARVVARHGGRIWADAERGEGATFYFTLEAGAADEPLRQTH